MQALLREPARPAVDPAGPLLRLIVPVDRLYREGLAAMAEALQPPTPALQQQPPANRRLMAETAYRNGLMLAMLAACPLRRRSFTLLEPGRPLFRSVEGFRLQLAPAEMKNGTALEAPLPPSLTPWLDRYLNQIRPRLLQGGTSLGLWISRHGTMMTCNSLSRRIEAITAQKLGQRLGMHLFRHCSATSLAQAAPEESGAVAALLGHQGTATAERYYNLARGSAAVAGYQERVLALRQRLRQAEDQRR